MDKNSNEHTVSRTAQTISNETRLSHKQATALLMREILDKKDREIAEVLDVAPASASSYISACRSKFNSVDEEIEQLDQEIEQWEKTEQLEGIVDRLDGHSPETALRNLSEAVGEELVDDENVTYLINYVDDQGEEKLLSTPIHPKNINDIENGAEVLQYKRLSSFDEVFE